jgi:hypothetical protein
MNLTRNQLYSNANHFAINRRLKSLVEGSFKGLPISILDY